ncbi:Solute carrier family 25 member 44 [Anthophora quadrimaculata]
MQHQVEQKQLQTLPYEHYNYIELNSGKSIKDVCSGNSTFHSYHRMGYDGQDKVLSTEHNYMYNGMIDAYKKIYQVEGVAGLYRGFWISSIQINGVIGNVDSRVKALIAGGAASLVGQTMVVPFDVLSQHLMVLGISTNKQGRYIDKMSMNPLGLTLEPGKSKAQISADIIKSIYQRDGYRGFYRGYVASLCAYVPNSALWWGLYTSYQEELVRLFPDWVSHLFIQAVAGTLGGFTTTIITNPLDVVRARLQVQRLDSYETIKRFSITEEYKGYIRW